MFSLGASSSSLMIEVDGAVLLEIIGITVVDRAVLLEIIGMAVVGSG